MTDLLVKWGGMGDFKKWVDPSNGGMILKWGVNTPVRAMERLLSSNPQVTSSNPRVTSSDSRVMSLNPRVTSSNS